MFKKILTFVCVIACIFTSAVFANDKIVNIYNWAGYLPAKVIRLFEKETGIKVNYTTFESNQILYAKLKANPNIGYDIVVPTTYIVDRMRKEKMLLPLDKAKIPNFNNLDPKLLNKSFDPNNKFSVPYLWGTTGILINTKYYALDDVKTWQDLWQKKYRNKILALNDMRDMYNIAFKILGYSINDQDPQHIKEAYLLLKSLLPNIKAFADNATKQMYINKEANIGVVASGDAYIINKEDKYFQYIYPKDGANIWFDSMVIPVGAKHVENAYKFINFILRPEIAKMISLQVGYATPNIAARKIMPISLQKNRILNPTAQDLQNTQVETDISQQAAKLYLYYWNLLK